MLVDIAKKAEKWKEKIDEYDAMIYDASRLTVDLSTARELHTFDEDRLEQELQELFEKLDKQTINIENAQKDLIKTIFEDSEEPYKQALMTTAISAPDFAGLDDAAIKSIKNEDVDMSSVLYLHQIYVEHVRLVVDKIIDYIEKLDS